MEKSNKSKECGDCTLCCELLQIPEINKPASVMCGDCILSKGCGIYNSRPNSCRNFNCLYLDSDDMDISLRPNECRVTFEKVTTKIYFGIELPKDIGSCKTPIVSQYIKSLNESGISVVISSFTNTPNEYFLAEGHKKEIIEKIIMNEYNKVN